MVTIKEIKTQIENANALGIASLTEKGVVVEETATTYEIMQGIKAIEKRKEEQEKTVNITENGTTEILPDENKALSKVTVVTNVDEGITPIDHTVTFTVDNEPYEIVSVKSGNAVNKPAVTPTKEDNYFNSWRTSDGDAINFPYTPTSDIELSAEFSDFEQIEYIQSTGTQYIDTGYIANQNTKIKCKYQIVGSKGEYDTLFSDFTNVQYSHIYDGETQVVKWGGEYSAFGSIIPASDITALEISNGTFAFTQNGVTTTQTIGANTEFTSPYSLILFCNRYYKNPSVYESASCCKARIYYFRIYEGETLMRDFVPAVDENGVFCFYDNVTKAYFYNKGTGEFVAVYNSKQ